MTDSTKATRFHVFEALICISLLLMAYAGYLIINYRISIAHLPKQPFELISLESDEPSMGPFQLGQIMQLNYPLTFRDHARNIYGDPIHSHIEDNKYNRFDNADFATKSFLTESYEFDVGVMANVHVETLSSGEILYIQYDYKYTNIDSCKYAHRSFERTLESRYNDSFWIRNLETGVFISRETIYYLEPTPDTFVALSKSCSGGSKRANYVSISLGFNANGITSKLLVSPLPQQNEVRQPMYKQDIDI